VIGEPDLANATATVAVAEPGASARQCHECAGTVSLGARFCRHCGTRLARLPRADLARIALDDRVGLRSCRACGIDLSDIARFCGRCGTAAPGRARGAIAALPADLSAASRLDALQRRRALAAVGLVAALLVVAPVPMLTMFVAIATTLYLAALVFRILLVRRSLVRPDVVTVSDEEARGVPDDELPVYTVLVPAYREPEVVGRLLASLNALEYPREKLEIRLLLEADDPETLEAVAAASPPPHVQVVRVPVSEPRTKPKACNYGLLGSTGELVTIYDAEDRPDPLQLRRAAVAFRRAPQRVACVQAKLLYHNAEQNLITRWFAAEYALWFEEFLPGLASLGTPIPLGGTSNHIRRRALQDMGGWDPHNVTEDADLGIRLHRAGYRTLVLDSVTLEEANSDFVNWAKQRSRWYKGYLQTWLVHARQPRRLWRELGPKAFVGFNLFVGGTPLLALMNPVFWALAAVWFLAKPDVIAALFPAGLYYLSLIALVAGNFVGLYSSMLGAHRTGRPGLVLAAVLVPAYWVMMSIAAIKALVQLVTAPSFWEKTAHGLDLAAPSAPAPRQVPDARG
jgi:cellulose synthase/poly-beta-1,6-N-acetylglucosamine synthase-like glycosyltransferase